MNGTGYLRVGDGVLRSGRLGRHPGGGRKRIPIGRHAVIFSEGLLDLGDTFVDANGRRRALDTGHDLLNIRGHSQVVGVGACFEDADDLVALGFDRCDQVVVMR
jgi:hypothetical protein